MSNRFSMQDIRGRTLRFIRQVSGGMTVEAVDRNGGVCLAFEFSPSEPEALTKWLGVKAESSDMEALRKELHSHVDSMAHEINEHNTHHAGIDRKLDALNVNLTDVRNRIDGIDDLQARVTQLENSFQTARAGTSETGKNVPFLSSDWGRDRLPLSAAKSATVPGTVIVRYGVTGIPLERLQAVELLKQLCASTGLTPVIGMVDALTAGDTE